MHRHLTWAVGLLLLSALPVRAEWLAPLVTETAETIGGGKAQIGLGATYLNDARFPQFTPRGDIKWQSLTAVPELGFRIAPADAIEIQASYELLALDQNTISSGKTSTFGGGDARLFTKVWAVRERTWIPATGVRFGVKLPNANKADHLGTDETDFMIEALASKKFGEWATHLNLGIAILGNPGFGGASPDGQDDLFTYDIALVTPGLGGATPDDWGVRGLVELDGASGSRFDNDFTAIRGGPQVSWGGWTFYLGASANLQGAAARYGISGGAFYTFALERVAALFED
ncbi:MAG: hypothetical protein ABI629_05135 [bacterium]